MARILINDGMHSEGVQRLRDQGHEVVTDRIEQDDLPDQLPAFDVVCVRSATKIRESLIALCPNLKIIGRGGVGLDNIDVDFARSRGIKVLNTPAASSRSVAELAMAHLMSIARSLPKSHQSMPSKGHTEFKSLKKACAKGIELEGKTLGLIGFGRIGQEMAKIALGVGMEVLPVDPMVTDAEVGIGADHLKLSTTVHTVSMDDMLKQADAISLHIPSAQSPILSAREFGLMKEGVIIINASRGGTIDEDALLYALDNGKVRAAGLDVFTGEPTPREDILRHPQISSTPHIGASTIEAQVKIATELAQQIIDELN